MAPIYQLEEVVLEVQDLSVRLGGNLILRDVDAVIRNITRPDCVTGQVYGLLGPSGIGKTQLFRRIAGLDPPTTGSVKVLANGTLAPTNPGLVGVVAQHYPLFAHRTVLGNLTVVGRRTGLSRADAHEKAMEYLKRFGLETHGSKWPAQLSGGQRQRVAIIQQLMCSGHFLLMDEPFSGLDPIAKDKACQLITEVAGLHELNTIVVVTHDIESAVHVSDHLWLIGRDHTPDGAVIAGARIQEEVNLIERGLAWRPNVTMLPEFSDAVREMRARFAML